MERIFFAKNNTLTDYSNELNCWTSKTALFDYVKNQDFLYIGSELPFNNKYFDVNVANDVESTMIIEYWTGAKWVQAIDIIDSTKVNNKSLAQSGHIQFNFKSTERNFSLADSENIPELPTINVYSLYWIRISFTESLKSTTSLKYIGQKFSEDEDIAPFYPELVLANTKSQFSSGKTNWNDQHYIAADHICRKLKVDGIIKHPNQILNWRVFTEASVHKVAEIIFLAFGDDFADNRKTALEYYNQAMKNVTNQVDLNNNAVLDFEEKFFRAGFMTR